MLAAVTFVLGKQTTIGSRFITYRGLHLGLYFFSPGGLFAGFKNHRRTSCLSLALCKKDKTLLFLMRKDVKQPKKEK